MAADKIGCYTTGILPIKENANYSKSSDGANVRSDEEPEELAEAERLSKERATGADAAIKDTRPLNR
jgi:hypothetical protein